MDPLIIAALISALPASWAAWNARQAKRSAADTSRIVKGNGEGNVAVMTEEVLQRLRRIESRADAHDLRHLAVDEALASLATLAIEGTQRLRGDGNP